MSLIEEQKSGLITIRRDNVILRVEPEQKEYYKGLGYNVVDEMGNVIEETVPTDIASLQRFYKDAKKEIAELKAEIKTLKAQKKAKTEAEVKPKEETVFAEKPQTETVTTSRRRRNRS